MAAPAERHASFQHRSLGTALRYQAADIMDRMLADVGMSPSNGEGGSR